jgi:hypothetical protein
VWRNVTPDDLDDVVWGNQYLDAFVAGNNVVWGNARNVVWGNLAVLTGGE